MKRARILVLATLLATSCTTLGPRGLSVISDPTDGNRRERTTQSLGGQSSYKGIQGHRHIKDFTDQELRNAAPNQLSIVVFDKNDLKKVAARLHSLGYKVKIGIGDTVVAEFYDSGIPGLRKHFEKLDKLSEVKVVTPRFKFEPQYSPLPPNDTFYKNPTSNAKSQWGLTGSYSINPIPAWKYPAIQSSKNVIAVIDTGVDIQHSDLFFKWVLGIDAGPTYTTFQLIDGQWQWAGVNQYDFQQPDLDGHGTLVAGIAAALTDNNEGIAGAGWGSQVMPINANDPGTTDSLYDDNIRAGIYWAIDHGAKVINMSLGSFYLSMTWNMEDGLKYAHQHRVPVIISSGNNNGFVLYPANRSGVYDNIIAVGATDDTGNRAQFNNGGSNFGPSLSLVAPGKNILSLGSRNATDSQYITQNGTSLAAPFVSGAFASLWSACSALPYTQIRDVLYATATDRGTPGRDDYYGHGILNFGAAADYLIGSGRVYQWIQPSSNYHSWTDDTTEDYAGAYQYERIAFGLRKTQAPGTVPLYRINQVYTGFHALSTDPNAGAPYYQVDPWNSVIGYIAPPSNPGAGSMYSPLFKLYRGGMGHYYTTNASEKDTLVNAQGWTYEGIVGYTW